MQMWQMVHRVSDVREHLGLVQPADESELRAKTARDRARKEERRSNESKAYCGMRAPNLCPWTNDDS